MVKNIAIIGFGGRGHIYGLYAKEFPEKFNLVAVCDTDEYKRNDARDNFNTEVYDDYKKLLDKGYKLDLVVISTQDAQHKEHAMYALNKGYDLLLEKPVAVTEEDCFEIYNCAKKNNCSVYVCHVLRYTPFYRAIKKVIDSGALGEIINIHASENVGYYHQAHSYVRGPWRNSLTSSPMILAKCCHDMDIIRYLIGEKCISLNSYGKLSYFKSENQPEGASDYCSDCKVKDCPYNAQTLYPKYVWPAGYFTHGELTKENILRDLKHCPYDRCVFKCDNNVVDHQSTLMLFDNGKTAVHTMTAFSSEIYRDIKIYGTKAELVGIMEKDFVEVRPFNKEPYKVEITNNASIGGHCGGDYYMMDQIYKQLNGEKGEGITYLEVSIESHLMSFAAERSRLNKGETQFIKLD